MLDKQKVEHLKALLYSVPTDVLLIVVSEGMKQFSLVSQTN